MPVNGLIGTFDAWSFSIRSVVSVAHSGDGVGSYSHMASALTTYTPNAIDVYPGISIQIGSTSSGWQVAYNGPSAPFGGYIVSGGAFASDVSIEVRLKNVKFYISDGGVLPIINWDSIEVYVNGAYNTSLGPSVSQSGSGCGPSYIPYIGDPLDVSWSCSASSSGLPTYTDSSVYDHESSAAQSVTGGWRFRILSTDDWQTLPITLPVIGSPSTTGCPYGLSLSELSASSTYGALGTAYSYSRTKRSYDGRTVPTYLVQMICSSGQVDDEGNPIPCSADGTVVYSGAGPLVCPDGVAQWRDLYWVESWGENRGGSVQLVPDLPRSIKRMQEGYQALWIRDGFPKTNASRSHSCTSSGVTSTTSDTPEIHARQTILLSAVGDAPHIIETPLGLHAFTPCADSHSKSYSKTKQKYFRCSLFQFPPSWVPYPRPTCPPGCLVHWESTEVNDLPADVAESESVSYEFPTSVENSTDNPYINTYQYHADPKTRYFNFWANPHWQYFLWFPPNTIDTNDDGIPDRQSQWQVDATNIDRQYWIKSREQWIYQSSLPDGEKLRTRNSLVASCLDESAHTPFLDTYCGGQRWIGVSRWLTHSAHPPTEKYLDGSDAWSVVSGGSASYGSASITITPTLSMVVLSCDVGRWDVSPFLFPHLCDKVYVDWLTSNINAVRIFLVGEDGSSRMLKVSNSDASTTRDHTYQIQKGPQSKYGGSWVIDNGAGYVTDEGADHDSNGISSTIMADPELVNSFNLLNGRTTASIRIEIDVISTGTTAEIAYPKFIYPAQHPALIQESGQVVDLLQPNGPGARWGNWVWYDGSTLNNPPSISGIGYKSTIVDWLCARRSLFEAVAYNGGTPDLTTELTQLFDTFEGQSVGQADRNSIAFILPKSSSVNVKCALVNTVSEVPPMALFPVKARDAATWLSSGDYALESWDWAQGYRCIVSDGPDPAHLFDPFGTAWTSSSPFSIPGWSVASHQHALDNSESGFTIQRLGITYGEGIRPWHGYLALIVAQASSGNGIWQWQDDDGSCMLITIDGLGNVWAHYSHFHAPFGGWLRSVKITTSGGCSNPDVYREPLARRHVVTWNHGSDLRRAVSSNSGKTWDEEVTIVSNIYHAHGAPDPNGDMIECGLMFDSGSSGPASIYGRVRGAGDTTWGAWTALLDTSGNPLRVDDAPQWGNPAKGRDIHSPWILYFTPAGETDPAVFSCVNARSGFRWRLVS